MCIADFEHFPLAAASAASASRFRTDGIACSYFGFCLVDLFFSLALRLLHPLSEAVGRHTPELHRGFSLCGVDNVLCHALPIVGVIVYQSKHGEVGSSVRE